MARTYRWFLLTVLLALAGALVRPAAAADKVSVLIIDGQNGHDWKATTPVIKDLLEKTGRFTVEVLTSPAKDAPKEQWDNFKADFSKYGVVLSNYCGDAWPEAFRTALEKYVNDGGGFVAYHFAVAAFRDWPAYNQMIGMGWKDNKFGEGLAYDDDGKLVRRPKGEGPGNGHGPSHEFEVMIRDKDDPITKGLPGKWMHVKDELYHGQRGPAKDMHILASAFSAKDKGGTGMHEPMAWTIPVGKGRAFTTLLGHHIEETRAPGRSHASGARHRVGRHRQGHHPRAGRPEGEVAPHESSRRRTMLVPRGDGPLFRPIDRKARHASRALRVLAPLVARGTMQPRVLVRGNVTWPGRRPPPASRTFAGRAPPRNSSSMANRWSFCRARCTTPAPRASPTWNPSGRAWPPWA